MKKLATIEPRELAGVNGGLLDYCENERAKGNEQFGPVWGWMRWAACQSSKPRFILS